MMLDKNNMDRLKALISLKKRCLHYQNMSFSRNFFTDLSQEIDVVLTSIINDEISNCTHRYGIEKILNEIITENKYYDFIEARHYNIPDEQLFTDIKSTFVDKADQIIYEYLFRFYISTLSAFEFWTCKAYDVIIKSHKSKNSKLKRFEKKINNLISLRIKSITDAVNETDTNIPIDSIACKLHNAIKTSEEVFTNDQQAIDLKDSIFSSNNYLSSKEKIDFVISKIDKLTTKENINDVRLFINFAFSLRNTIHTCGINKTGNDYSLKIGECYVEMPNGKSANYNNHAEFIRKWHLVIDLYSDIFMHLGNNFENEFCDTVNEI
ncbi:hypothetical protein [Aeromonas dhakensis]|uniref:hypothetical protein n=1 Tax=Aeromonas dhakensis TaxID=196024 RepID=UPI003BA2D378